IIIGIALSVRFRTGSQFRQESSFRTIAKGVLAGFLGSVVGILGVPLLTTGTMASSIGVLEKPSYLLLAAFLSLGWVYGALAAGTLYLICHRRFRTLMLLMAVFAIFGLLERIPILHWFRRW